MSLKTRLDRLEGMGGEDPRLGVTIIVPWEVVKEGLAQPDPGEDPEGWNAWLVRLGYPHAIGRKVTILPGQPPSIEEWAKWAQKAINEKVA